MGNREPVVGLEELFEDEPGTPDPGEPRVDAPIAPFGPRWWARRLFLAVAGGAVLFGVLWIARIGVSPALLIAAILAVSVLREALRQVAGDPLPPEVTGKGLQRVEQDGFAGPLEGLRYSVAATDGMRFAVGRWDDRLIWGERDAGRFSSLVLPRIGELVDERLRQRHGVTMASAPQQSRRLLGDDLWGLLHTRATRTLSPRDVAAIVKRVEEL